MTIPTSGMWLVADLTTKRCTSWLLTARMHLARSATFPVTIVLGTALALISIHVWRTYSVNPYQHPFVEEASHLNPKERSIDKITHYVKTYRNIHEHLDASKFCTGNVLADLRRLRQFVEASPRMQRLNKTIHSIWDAEPHFKTKHVLKETIEDLLYVQTCQYRNLDYFQYHIAPHINISQYSALAGSLIGVRCHNSMVIWDDDIDVFVEDCAPMHTLFHSLDPGPATAAHDWRFAGRRLNNEWDLFLTKHDHIFSVFKLRPRDRPMPRPTQDLGGLDIECKNHWILAMLFGFGRSGNLLTGHKTLVHEFGPTSIHAPAMNVILDTIDRKYPLPRKWKPKMQNVMQNHCPIQD